MKNRKKFWILAGVLVGLTSVAPLYAEGKSEEELGPDAILYRMREVYQACRSYQDTGRITIFQSRSNGFIVEEGVFSTSMKRGVGFRLEYRTHRTKLASTGFASKKHPPKTYRGGDPVVVWGNDGRARLFPEVVRSHPSSLQEALCWSNAITDGIACRISSGLYPSYNLCAWGVGHSRDFTKAKLLQEGDVEGHACFRVSGKTPNENEAVVWIDKQSFLVRRIDESRSGTTECTVYSPSVNGDVPSSDLALAPMERVTLPAVLPVLAAFEYEGARYTVRLKTEVVSGGQVIDFLRLCYESGHGRRVLWRASFLRTQEEPPLYATILSPSGAVFFLRTTTNVGSDRSKYAISVYSSKVPDPESLPGVHKVVDGKVVVPGDGAQPITKFVDEEPYGPVPESVSGRLFDGRRLQILVFGADQKRSFLTYDFDSSEWSKELSLESERDGR